MMTINQTLPTETATMIAPRVRRRRQDAHVREEIIKIESEETKSKISCHVALS